MFWALLRTHFNPRRAGPAKMSLSRAQNIFMPKNISQKLCTNQVYRISSNKRPGAYLKFRLTGDEVGCLLGLRKRTLSRGRAY